MTPVANTGVIFKKPFNETITLRIFIVQLGNSSTFYHLFIRPQMGSMDLCEPWLCVVFARDFH